MALAVHNQIWRGAMIVAGSIAVHQIRAWQSINNTWIAALANVATEGARCLTDDVSLPDVRIYAHHQELLACETLKVVDDVTPLAFHEARDRAVDVRGVHALCQKRFAETVTHAWDLIDDAVRCVIYETWCWRPWYRRVRWMLAEQTIGTPRFARLYHHCYEVLPCGDGILLALWQRQPILAVMPRKLSATLAAYSAVRHQHSVPPLERKLN